MRKEIEAVYESIEKACLDCGADKSKIQVLAATKTVSCERINELPSCGITLAGENRVQEFTEKYDKVRGITWDFIGALQTNKVKYLMGKTRLIHSLDRHSLADELDRQSGKLGIVTDALIEVNVGGEQSKSGVGAGGFDELYEYCLSKKNLRIKGVMSVMPKDARENLYDAVYELFRKKESATFDTLSVGMSGDYLTAIKHGSNLVRLGSIIFGKRI